MNKLCLAGCVLATFLTCNAAVLPNNILQMQKEAAAQNGEIWAVLVAGSNGWWNYRHQADICHAYHILSAHGIPDDHIVVMMYDDIANNPSNPTPGVLINKPNGTNVYPGTPKDYTGNDVTPENFLKILQGESMEGVGTGKTLHSTANDRVFVYFADHGATGLVAFPVGELYAKDLNDALKNMHTQNKYSQLVFYMEACESGSMFNELLPKDINVYALTASNPFESSWGCYCDNPEHLPCLGDLFSVMWMQDSDKEDLQKETLKTQYEIVKKDTTKSHVMQYGDLSFENEPVADFQGLKKPSGNIVVNKAQDLSPVPSPDVYTYYLKQQYERASTAELKEQALKQLNWARQKRAYVDRTISYIVERVTPGTTGFATLPSLVMSQRPERLSQVECHKEVAREFGRKCFLMHKSPYAMTQSSYVLANLCEMGLPADALKNAVSGVCDSLLDKPTDVQ